VSPVEVELFYFLPLFLAAYWLGPRRRGWQNTVLLVAGYLFFASWSGRLLGLLVAGTVVDFILLRLLGQEGENATASPARRRLILWFAIVAITAEILYFKYQGFLAGSLQALLGSLGLPVTLRVASIIAPVGLSFRALQRISVYVDVYRGRQQPPQSLLDYAVFVAFFPQMLAGPITRASQLLTQLEQPRAPAASMWARGAWALLVGFTLKAFCADVIGTRLVDPVFNNQAAYTAGSHWIALAGFALQVFGDFAGYSLIAIGLGLFFSIELPVNFNFPFISRTLTEFWRRWHITLNSWLFDYIFFPLTVETKLFRGRVIAAFFVTFMVSGLWHGASWTFVAWGFLQGLGLTVQTLWERRFAKLARTDRRWVARRKSAWYGRGAWLLTQGFFVLSLIPFRAGSFSQAMAFARGLLLAPGHEVLAFRNPQLVAAVAAILLYQFTPLAPGQRVIGWFQQRPPLLQGMAVGVAIVLLLILTPAGSGTFIYAQF
jgi:alginate O-acetyltransferase complex protein AlgI